MSAKGTKSPEEKRSGWRQAAAGATERATNKSNQLLDQHSSQGLSAAEQVLQEVAADCTAHYFHKERGERQCW